MLKYLLCCVAAMGKMVKITIKEETIPRVVSMRDDCGLRLEQHRNGKGGGGFQRYFELE